MRILTHADVADLLDMAGCIEAVDAAFRALAEGGAVQPLRPLMRLPDHGLVGLMPGYLPHLGEHGVAGVKAITVFPGNHGTELDSHQGAVLLYDGGDGRLIATVDATSITATRTAAASAVATRALALPAASTLAIIGSGTQARSHLLAMQAVRPVRDVRVWSRNPDAAHDFAGWAASTHDTEVTVAGSVADAVAGAHIVCTTTAAVEPVVTGAMLEPGMHVNAVGACTPTSRELDGAAMARAAVFADRRESALAEAGAIIIARDEGVIDEQHILAEIGEVLVGDHPGRSDEAAITLFQSLGLAVQDVASAHLVYERALAAGRGVEVDFGGRRADLS